MLAIALVLDGASREDAARTCGMDRQTLRDWVHRFNVEGLAGLSNDNTKGERRPRLTPEQKAELAAVDGNGAEVLARLRASDLLRRSRLLILFAPTVDVHDYSGAFWIALNAVDPARDLTLLPDVGLNIDASSPPLRPLSPDPITVAQVAARAGEYGLPELWFVDLK
jgi:transposase-like protein